MANKSYQIITDRIVKMIEKGTCPWRMPWSKAGLTLQSNAKSEANYRGVNQVICMMTTYTEGYEYSQWLTYKQAKDLGGQVRKGEKGTPCVRFGEFEVTDDDDKSKRVPFLRHYTVFNLAQIDDLPEEMYDNARVTVESRSEYETIEAAQAIVDGWQDGPTIEHGGERACYSPSQDRVRMPEQPRFNSDAQYYATLFHELGHATGHVDRLARKTFRDNEFSGFGSHDYGAEELVAEFASAFLCQKAGIDNDVIDNQAAYLAGWLKAIKADPKLLVVAAGQAQKAADMICSAEPVTV